MKIRSSVRICAALPVLIAGLVLAAPAANLLPVSPINSTASSPITGAGDSIAPIISPDGRYVLFSSTANNLVANGTNGPFASRTPPRLNVFIRDRTSETSTLVSVNLAGTGGGDGDSFPREISTDGRFALFESGADNLVAGDTNNAVDIFVRDLVQGGTRLVSTNMSGGSANGLSRDSVMTPDGRYVAFSSLATNLVAGDTNGIADIFVTDLQSGITTLASPGASGPGSCDTPEITPDGHYVAFISTATNLVNGGLNASGIYVRDLIGLTTILAGTNSNTSEPPYNHRISDDGRYVVFEVNPTSTSPVGNIMRYNTQSGITDMVATDAVAAHNAFTDFRSLEMTPDGQSVAFIGITNGSMAVFVWNASNGATSLASLNTSQVVSTNALADWPQIDASGRYVSFLSTATDLVTNVVTGAFHLYVYDLTNATMQLVDVDTNGAGSPGDFLSIPRMTPDGKSIAFDSTDGNLVSSDGNLSYDVFARNLASGTTELISVRNPGLGASLANGALSGAVYSVNSNGQYVAFTTTPATPTTGTVSAYRNVFVCDTINVTNILISVDTNGMANANSWSTDPVISGDGRYVAFASSASNLVAGGTNTVSAVFLRDLQAGTTTLLSQSNPLLPAGNYLFTKPAMSQDGRYLLYHAKTATGGTDYLLWRDLQQPTNVLVTSVSGTALNAMTPDGRHVVYANSGVKEWDSQLGTTKVVTTFAPVTKLAVSADGTRVACRTGMNPLQLARLFLLPENTSVALGLAPGTVHSEFQFSADAHYLAYIASDNQFLQANIYNLQTKSNQVISRAYNSSANGSGNCDYAAISADGRFVAYQSVATNLVPGDANGVADLFLYDQTTGITTLVSANQFGTATGNGESINPVFTSDSQTVLFKTWASDLSAQDFNPGNVIFALGLYSNATSPPLNVNFAGHPGNLMWSAIEGKTYQVQFKNDLGDSNWQTLNSSITVVGNHAYLVDPAPNGTQRFYRVVSN